MAAPHSPPRLLPSCDSAITVEFSRKHRRGRQPAGAELDGAMASAPVAASPRTVPTYRSLLVQLRSRALTSSKNSATGFWCWRSCRSQPRKNRRWRIPVVYGGAHGIDLEDVAKTLNTTPDDIVARYN